MRMRIAIIHVELNPDPSGPRENSMKPATLTVAVLVATSTTAASDERASAGSVAFGYGLTQWWFTEGYAKFNRFGSGSAQFDAFEWENKLALTEPGAIPVDAGLLVEVEFPHHCDEGYELRIGPLLQKDFGPVQANANLFLGRHYRAASPEATELEYQWQINYRWRESFELGAQAPVWNAAYLFGATRATPDGTLGAQVEYGF